MGTNNLIVIRRGSFAPLRAPCPACGKGSLVGGLLVEAGDEMAPTVMCLYCGKVLYVNEGDYLVGRMVGEDLRTARLCALLDLLRDMQAPEWARNLVGHLIGNGNRTLHTTMGGPIESEA